MKRCHSEIVSNLIESYRNDNYEENLYLIKEKIYKDGCIRPLKTELFPYKEDATLNHFFDRKYVTAEELEAHLNYCFPDYNISVNHKPHEYHLYSIKIIWYKNGDLQIREFRAEWGFVIKRENWKYVRQMVREQMYDL